MSVSGTFCISGYTEFTTCSGWRIAFIEKEWAWCDFRRGINIDNENPS